VKALLDSSFYLLHHVDVLCQRWSNRKSLAPL